MAQTKLILSSLSLMLILTHKILFSEGRQLQIDYKNEFPNFQTHTKISEKETITKIAHEHSIKLHGDRTNKAAYAADAVPAAPMTPLMAPMPASPAVAGSPPPSPPPPGHVDDFRPTAPGHSPGVGHSLQN
ncbi:unnamed protein product [Ilex paraguariensis]|uniref:Uncharacterized protein n=1 Tax=Ilex paraguariensis TaxID=185542 RepID=A0ABC8TAL0_9AQUA